MTLEQLSSLTEQELDMCLYVVNVLAPVPGVPDIPPHGLTWFKKGVLEQKIGGSFQQVKREHHSIFSSLLNKLGVQHEIKYETPPSGSIETSGSL